MKDTLAYSLPFPSEPQRSPTKKTLYSSLEEELGENPDYAIYLTGPPVRNPSYPYPARNVLNPGTYPSRTPLMASNGRRPREPEDNTRSSHRTDILSCNCFVPQPTSVRPHSPTRSLAGLEFPPIQFRRKDGNAPFTVGEILAMGHMPDLVGGSDLVFDAHVERVIKVKIIWPGYARYATEKRICTTGSELTRSLLLVILATYIEEFARDIHSKNIPVEPDQEQWAIQWPHEERSNSWKDCVITSLHHRAGSTWQPEIYLRRK
ncbi:hypothetical protein V8B97DRAFT_343606 [Scleroderma yunnanense]